MQERRQRMADDGQTPVLWRRPRNVIHSVGPADTKFAQNVEYLLFLAAVPVLGCNYRSFNSARALIEAAATRGRVEPVLAIGRDGRHNLGRAVRLEPLAPAQLDDLLALKV